MKKMGISCKNVLKRYGLEGGMELITDEDSAEYPGVFVEKISVISVSDMSAK